MLKSKPIKIFCYAEGRPGDWEAICPTFDLAAQGESFEEVRRVLHEMIADYIVDISQLPEADFNRLIKRKAPLFLRLSLYYKFIIAMLAKHKIS